MYTLREMGRSRHEERHEEERATKARRARGSTGSPRALALSLSKGAFVASWLHFVGATLAVTLVAAQTSTDQPPVMAEAVFKNIQVLKGTTVNELMGTMGVFSAALGISCEDCHTGSDSG